MLVTRVKIRNFGIFQDAAFDFGPGLTVLEGPNEAGKSTLLAFLRWALFGTHAIPPLRGGQAEGSVCLQIPGGTAEVTRWARGPRSSTVRVVLPGNVEGTEADLQAMLGRADSTLFTTVFSFSEAELGSFDQLGSDEIRARIFEAGISGAGQRATVALTKLVNARDELLRTSGRGKAQISDLAADLEKCDAALREARALAAGYPTLVGKVQRLGAEVAGLVAQRAEAEADAARYEHLVQLWPIWLERQAFLADLDQLDPIDEFPAPDDRLLEKHENDVADARQAGEALANQRDEAREQLAALVLDSRLQAAGPAVEALWQERSEQARRLQELPAHRSRVPDLESALDRALGDLGPGWDESRLSAFDRSIPAREEVRSVEERLDSARAAVHDAQVAERQAAESLGECEAATEEARAALAALRDLPDRDRLAAASAAVGKLRPGLAQRDRRRDRAEDRERTAADLERLRDQASGAPAALPGWMAPAAAFVAVALLAL
ncbi:MAG: AAA family ATPase, partial [Candidatus Sericytochromatia bacterium]|nr:AAA family ATPase [Candidatus Tanganyikabacteria bacterium]